MPERKGRKKKEPQLTTEGEPEVEIARLVEDKRAHKIIGAVLLFLAFFLVVAVISHVIHWKKDQDVVRPVSYTHLTLPTKA